MGYQGDGVWGTRGGGFGVQGDGFWGTLSHFVWTLNVRLQDLQRDLRSENKEKIATNTQFYRVYGLFSPANLVVYNVMKTSPEQHQVCDTFAIYLPGVVIFLIVVFLSMVITPRI